MTVFTRWVEVTEIQHIYENHIHCSNFGTLAGGQKSKNRKMFVFFGTKFCSLKMTSQDFRNSYRPDLFFRRFKICNLILPSLLGNGKINMYFQRFWGFFFRFSQSLKPLTGGGGVNSKSHLSHDWRTSLWNTYEKKVRKFTV